MLGMGELRRLNERATKAASSGPSSFWHVGGGRSLFAGPLHHNDPHRHSVPVYLAGLYGTFRLRIGSSGWLSCRTAAIPAGVPYEFDMRGEPLAVFYLEPNVAGIDTLTPLVGDGREVNRALVGHGGEFVLLRDLYEGRASRRCIGPALEDLTDFSSRRATQLIDPRVSRVVERMHTNFARLDPAADVASSIGLSASRFQHLFTENVGVPFRRYRAWHRLRAAIHEIVGGSSFTSAAHAAGFADQAHFAREFRRTFGASASRGISKANCA